ncbi:MAG: hypothetical protein R3D45_01105 [Rhizobiaceae bacterium]
MLDAGIAAGQVPANAGKSVKRLTQKLPKQASAHFAGADLVCGQAQNTTSGREQTGKSGKVSDSSPLCSGFGRSVNAIAKIPPPALAISQY